MMDLDIETMQADYEKFQALAEKTGKRAENLKLLIEKLGDRLVMCPRLREMSILILIREGCWILSLIHI